MSDLVFRCRSNPENICTYSFEFFGKISRYLVGIALPIELNLWLAWQGSQWWEIAINSPSRKRKSYIHTHTCVTAIYKFMRGVVKLINIGKVCLKKCNGHGCYNSYATAIETTIIKSHQVTMNFFPHPPLKSCTFQSSDIFLVRMQGYCRND